MKIQLEETVIRQTRLNVKTEKNALTEVTRTKLCNYKKSKICPLKGKRVRRNVI